MLVEDLHWAEEPLLDLLERCVQRVQGPLLLVATARPELLDGGPAGARECRTRRRSQLERAAAPRDRPAAGRQLVPVELPDGAARRSSSSRAEGNPFFVEELVGTLIDRACSNARNGGWVVQRAPGGLRGPGHRAGRARGAHRPPRARREGGAPGGGGDRPHLLAGPVYELVERRSRTSGCSRSATSSGADPARRSPGEREYAIKHALTREVAYASLPKARRARLHAALRRAGSSAAASGATSTRRSSRTTTPRLSAPRTPTSRGPDDEGRLRELRERRSLARGARPSSRSAATRSTTAVALLQRAARLEPDASSAGGALAGDRPRERPQIRRRGVLAAMQHAIELAATPRHGASSTPSSRSRRSPGRDVGRAPDASSSTAGSSERSSWPARTTRRAPRPSSRAATPIREVAGGGGGGGRAGRAHGDPALRSYAHDVRGLTAFVARDYEESLRWHHRRLGTRRRAGTIRITVQTSSRTRSPPPSRSGASTRRAATRSLTRR